MMNVCVHGGLYLLFSAYRHVSVSVLCACALGDAGKDLSRCLLLNMVLFLWCQIDPKPCTPRGMQPEKSRTKEGWVRESGFFTSRQPRRGVSAGGRGLLILSPQGHEKTQRLSALLGLIAVVYRRFCPSDPCRSNIMGSKQERVRTFDGGFKASH